MEQTRAEQAQERFNLAHKAYRKKIKTYARNSFYLVPGFEEVDMEQELLSILYAAVQAYDPTRGAFFNSFVQQCFRNHIGKLKASATREKRTAEVTSLDIKAVQYAVDSRRSLPSAEDELVQKENLREAYRQAPIRLQRRWDSEFSEAG